MNFENPFIFLLIAFCLGLFILVFHHKTSESQKNFILGNRNLGFLDIFSSVITYMRTGSNLVFWFGFVAFMGFGSIWILISFYTAFIIMTLLAGKAAKLSRKQGYVTFPDLIEDRQGRLMSMLVSTFSLYVIIIMTVSQLFIAGTVAGELASIGNILGTILCATIVGIYISFGGFMSVVKTDVYQAAVIVIIALCAYLFLDWPTIEEFTTEVTQPNWTYVIGFGLIGFAVPASTDMWQRFYAVKEEKILRKSIFSALIADMIIVFGLIIFIKYVLSFAGSDGNSDLFAGLFSKENEFPLVTALFGLFVVSALLSTIDNQIFNLASITSKNILKIDTEKQKDRFVKTLRISSVISLVIFVILSLTIKDFMQWIIDTYAFVSVITPFIFYGVITKANSDKLLALGVIVAGGLYWILHMQGLYANMNWYALPFFIPLVFIAYDQLTMRHKTAKA